MLLGEILVEQFDVDPKDVEKALKFQESYGGRIGSILLNMGIISDEGLIEALALQLNLAIYQNEEEIDFANLNIRDLNLQFLLEKKWFPVESRNNNLLFVSVDPLDFEVNQYLFNEGIKFEVAICTDNKFREISTSFESQTQMNESLLGDISDLSLNEVERLRELASEAPVVNLVNNLVSMAIKRNASDLHFEPYKNMYRVRLRIDGILHDVEFLPEHMQLPVSSRIKILAGMDIAERRKPQDGKIAMRIAGKDLDIRVSSLPLAHGESIALRFLIKESLSYDLDVLGIEEDILSLLEEDILKTSGVILLTGPTGSGKTTTLYSILNRINSEEKKIITLEDPVEYQLDGINQIQIHPEIGYDFPAALRSIVRQDPDVIMVGEIRDVETARIAMQSSLTGHLVFSTVHTNDAPSAFTRLIDLGVEVYLLNASIVSIVAQRLVRKLCPKCATRVKDVDTYIKGYSLEGLIKKYNLQEPEIFLPVGCKYCDNTGYKGRVAIMEYLRCTDYIKVLPKDSNFTDNVRNYMNKNNIRNLYQDGIVKVLKGITSFDEVLRVAG